MPAAPPIWSGLTPEEHEVQYNPQRAFPDAERYRRRRDPANARARADLACAADVSYGDHPLRALDIYPATPRAGQQRRESGTPVHLFLHGGYWRAQDKANFAFVAGALVPLGVTTVIANYELCPDATLDEVADSALAAMAWTVRNIAEHGGDPSAVTLSGHSAGAHLGAEVIAHDWASQGLPADIVRGAVLTSGIYDPAPAALTSVNAQLNLDADIAARRNVETRPPRVDCDIALLAGGLEPWQWIDQTFRYAHHLRRHGRDPAVHVIPGRNHFDILDEYLDADSQTMRAILAQVAESSHDTASGAAGSEAT